MKNLQPHLLWMLSLATVLQASSAWMLGPSRLSRPPMVSLKSAPAAESGVSEGTNNLSPEYEAARKQAIELLSAHLKDKKELMEMLSHFVGNYMENHQKAYAKTGDEAATPMRTLKRFVETIQTGLKTGMGPNKFTFEISHKAVRGKDPESEGGNTFDFYKFGIDFFRSCMDVAPSHIKGQDNLKQAMEQVKAGENVVFLSNHQSEADPQVISVCMEEVGYGEEAPNMIYVAGHKVTTDPLAVPFSMGCNLICIHSKKHIDKDLETKPLKQKQNLVAMNAVLEAFKKGGSMLWVAPSGGRDRRDVETGEIPMAPFDSKTIDMFRLLGNKSQVKTHYYTLALVSYELCPPPDYTVAGVGEERVVNFTPIGMAVGPEIPSVGGLEKRRQFNEQANKQCEEDYKKLRQALGVASGGPMP